MKFNLLGLCAIAVILSNSEHCYAMNRKSSTIGRRRAFAYTKQRMQVRELGKGNEISREYTQFQKTPTEEEERLRAEVVRLRGQLEQVSDLQTKYDVLKKECDDFKEERLGAEVVRLRDQLEQVSDLQTKYDVLPKKCDVLKKERGDFKEERLRAEVVRLRDQLEQVSDLQAKYDALQRKCDVLKKECDDFKKESDILKKESGVLQKKCDVFKKESDDFKKERDTLKEQYNEALKNQRNFENSTASSRNFSKTDSNTTLCGEEPDNKSNEKEVKNNFDAGIASINSVKEDANKETMDPLLMRPSVQRNTRERVAKSGAGYSQNDTLTEQPVARKEDAAPESPKENSEVQTTGQEKDVINKNAPAKQTPPPPVVPGATGAGNVPPPPPPPPAAPPPPPPALGNVPTPPGVPGATGAASVEVVAAKPEKFLQDTDFQKKYLSMWGLEQTWDGGRKFLYENLDLEVFAAKIGNLYLKSNSSEIENRIKTQENLAREILKKLREKELPIDEQKESDVDAAADQSKPLVESEVNNAIKIEEWQKLWKKIEEDCRTTFQSKSPDEKGNNDAEKTEKWKERWRKNLEGFKSSFVRELIRQVEKIVSDNVKDNVKEFSDISNEINKLALVYLNLVNNSNQLIDLSPLWDIGETVMQAIQVADALQDLKNLEKLKNSEKNPLKIDKKLVTQAFSFIHLGQKIEDDIKKADAKANYSKKNKRSIELEIAKNEFLKERFGHKLEEMGEQRKSLEKEKKKLEEKTVERNRRGI